MEPKPTYETTVLPPAEIAERWWLAFTPEHEPTAAAACFIERTGAPPEYLVKTPTMLLVGPLRLSISDYRAARKLGEPRAANVRIGPQLALPL